MTRELRTPVTRTYIVRRMCKCGGEMLPTGLVLTVFPPRYPHRCQVCDAMDDAPLRAYPYIDYDYGNEATRGGNE